MKSAALVSFAFLFSSVALPAQNASYGVGRIVNPSQSGASNQPTVLQPPVMVQGCPVSLRAQHGAGAGMLQADMKPPKGPGQLLHLTLTNPAEQQIVSAQVKVHGLSGTGRTTKTTSDTIKPDSTRTLVVQFSADSPKTVAGDLWVPSMTAVLSIDLNSVTFSDGSTRVFTPRDNCRVAPDLKMLIADH